MELVNAFTSCKQYLEDNGITSKDIMTQYDF